MIHVGCHLSSSNGFEEMGKHALRLGADTFAFFTRNPRGGKAKEIDEEDAEKLKILMREHCFGTLVAHAPYTMNLCSDRENIRKFALNMLKDDLMRMEFIPDNFYNFHPGSHVGQGSDQGIRFVVEALDAAMFENMRTTVLLETMAGKGSEIGGCFEELEKIIGMVKHPEKIGVCLDTCHVWDGGYAIAEDLDRVLDDFDKIIGLNRLKAVHLNDSKNPFSARKDRHECLGKGYIGAETLRTVIRHPCLQNKPFILETPNDDKGYAEEIAWVRTEMI